MSAFDNTFKAAIPGSSLTMPMGSMPHQKPPKYVDPNEFLEYLWKQLHQKDTLKMLWHTLENGAPVSSVTRAILYKAVLSGMIQMNLGVVVYRTAFQMIDTLGKSKGIKTVLYPKLKNKTKDMMLKFNTMKILKNTAPQRAEQSASNIQSSEKNPVPDAGIGLLNQVHNNNKNV